MPGCLCIAGGDDAIRDVGVGGTDEACLRLQGGSMAAVAVRRSVRLVRISPSVSLLQSSGLLRRLHVAGLGSGERIYIHIHINHSDLPPLAFAFFLAFFPSFAISYFHSFFLAVFYTFSMGGSLSLRAVLFFRLSVFTPERFLAFFFSSSPAGHGRPDRQPRS